MQWPDGELRDYLPDNVQGIRDLALGALDAKSLSLNWLLFSDEQQQCEVLEPGWRPDHRTGRVQEKELDEHTNGFRLSRLIERHELLSSIYLAYLLATSNCLDI